MTLLYVESNSVIRVELERTLDLAGVDVITASSVDNALLLLINYQVDIVLIGDISDSERLLEVLEESRIPVARLSNEVPTDVYTEIPIWRQTSGIRLDLVTKICDLFDSFNGRPRSSAVQMLHPGDCAVGFRGILQKA